MPKVIVSGSFDDLRSRHVRFLQEAARWGPVHVDLWSDDTVRRHSAQEPRFPEQERLYSLGSIRYVEKVRLSSSPFDPASPEWREGGFEIWAVDSRDHSVEKETAAELQGLTYRIVTEKRLDGFPASLPEAGQDSPSRSKVIVTGCFDWLHSGHIRFFQEASAFGRLYVGVGSDRNIRLLKGESHPLFGQEERRYLVQSIRYVHEAFITSGQGWMDAEPDIDRIRPDLYVVNEDGDQPDKREFCARHGIEYQVLKRVPQEGLPRRESTALRGF